jgi:hypothetical protein
MNMQMIKSYIVILHCTRISAHHNPQKIIQGGMVFYYLNTSNFIIMPPVHWGAK